MFSVDKFNESAFVSFHFSQGRKGSVILSLKDPLLTGTQLCIPTIHVTVLFIRRIIIIILLSLVNSLKGLEHNSGQLVELFQKLGKIILIKGAGISAVVRASMWPGFDSQS